MVIEVEIYSEIRKLTIDGMSQRAIAKKLGVSRQTVKKYGEGGAMPGHRKSYNRQAGVITPEVIRFIESCFKLDAEENLPKQKHTAKQIHNRLLKEMEFCGGESTIRRIVRAMRADAAVPSQAMMPLSYSPGEAMQIDWGIASVYLNGKRRKVNLFCARLCYSCDIFVVAFHSANEESFLEAQQLAFDHFGGVSRRIIFDNAKIAVKEGFGLHAKPQARYLSFKAHYAFELDFCNPAKGNEKGLVESLVGYARRNFLVPIPHFPDMETLNEHLRIACLDYRQSHRIRGRSQSVLEMHNEEALFLITLPIYRFDTSKTVIRRPDDYSTVRFEKNRYSIPTRYLAQEVTVKGYGNRVVFYHRNAVIASYERSYASGETLYQLQHYIDLLERKPRSVQNAKPVKATVAEELLEWGKLLPGGNKDMVRLLRLCVDYGQDQVLRVRHQVPGGVSPTVDLVRSYLVPSETPPAFYLQSEMEVRPVDLSIYDRKYDMAVER